ncbi:hypothetical protein FB45DRAFT_921848 [Roridomyces roridus]|uniref:F-box domain-containing protein n=1 Tax=Roridomyces roridus TaxID=1738132 RepID=A0AAD7FKN7_9AGAR|nr:hypothetical protein FB45DRAFT_921848 [Roridomyces roridus]
MLQCPDCSGILGRPSSVVSSHFLETNAPLTDPQTLSSVRDFVSSARDHRARLDAKIAALQSSLDNLVLERDALDIEIHKHEGALSPLRRMPPEVISHIFTLNLQAKVDSTFYFDDCAPWTLSAVSARWRDIALSPFFWTTISNWVQKFDLRRLELQLVRSGNLPLRIHFSVKRHSDFTPLETQVVDLLAQHGLRWETIHLKGPAAMYSRIEDVLPQFPLLRKLQCEIYRGDLHAYTLDFFSHAPKLEEVVVKANLWRFALTLALPWHQLLRYRAATVWDSLPELAFASNLVECTLDMGFKHAPIDPGIQVLLPRLLPSRLSISHRVLLVCLETPALTDLYYFDVERSKSLNDLASFLPNTLKKLVLHTHNDCDNLSCLFEALPQIEYFALTEFLDVHVICDFLGSNAMRTTRPGLERVGLAALALNTAQTLLDTLEVVDSECLPALDLWVYVYPDLSPEMLFRVEHLGQRGMEFNLCTSFDQASQAIFHRRFIPEMFYIDHS